ncbi:hypothetical protein TeGR_g7833 [Tetraparma gracilis]|uniref:URB1 C-terminal domain-containing protein n=1 Tax=Tetraparma gracilis TaxID=2962635 RepID=A0ABQ6MZ07_9STRA|nr:hypothetical protein TeGR_g7833 [Tetraparma gracilis]
MAVTTNIIATATSDTLPAVHSTIESLGKEKIAEALFAHSALPSTTDLLSALLSSPSLLFTPAMSSVASRQPLSADIPDAFASSLLSLSLSSSQLATIVDSRLFQGYDDVLQTPAPKRKMFTSLPAHLRLPSNSPLCASLWEKLSPLLLKNLPVRAKMTLAEPELGAERDVMEAAAGLLSSPPPPATSSLFIRACYIFPRAIKNPPTPDYVAFLLSAANAYLTAVPSHAHASDVLGQHAGAINAAALSLLKNGMKQESGEHAPALLHLLRRIVAFLDSTTPLTPDKVLALIMSHSNFENCLSAESAVAAPLLKLMLECLERTSPVPPSLVEQIFSSVNAAHRAGLSDADVAIRAITKTLTDKHGGEWQMDELRWGGEAEGGAGGGYGKWSWLFSAVDDRRVKATISSFPLADRLDGETEDCEEGEDDEKGGSRYSPAFVLPLALAMLEVFSVDEEREAPPPPPPPRGEDEDGMEDEEDVEAEEERRKYTLRADAFVALAKRMCDNGVLALSLSSLASVDPALRKVALITVAVIHRGMEMREAKRLSGWSARPQLELVVGSVLRGVGRRMQINNASASAGGTFDAFYVPRFPGITSLFLARTTFIMMQPRNDMYANANSYFLRQKTGAFVDTNTVPNFNNLFTSSSETAEGAKADRLWVLKLLVDGILSAYDFKAAQKRFVPALVMTVFDSTGSGEEEKRMCLLVLETMIRRGGKAGVAGLIQGGLGLVGWLAVVGNRSWADWGKGTRKGFSDLVNLVLECLQKEKVGALVIDDEEEDDAMDDDEDEEEEEDEKPERAATVSERVLEMEIKSLSALAQLSEAEEPLLDEAPKKART